MSKFVDTGMGICQNVDMAMGMGAPRCHTRSAYCGWFSMQHGEISLLEFLASFDQRVRVPGEFLGDANGTLGAS